MMNNVDFSSTVKMRAKFEEIFPQGVNSPLRSFSEVDSRVLIMQKAYGSQMIDVDGNVYSDFISGLGSLILGHSPPSVIQSVAEQMENGTIFSCCHTTEAEYGAAVASGSEFIERLRFVCSGTEAVMGAIRVARAYTGREKILRFTGGYHGHSDDVFYRAESGVGNWRSVGLIDGRVSTLTCEYGNSESVELMLEQEGDVAAIIIEPVASNMGLQVPSIEFLKSLRSLASKYGCLLIFDEVVSGFRFCYGSVANLFKVEPDLVCFGKIIGGGFPAGCFGGRSDIMDVIERVPGYFQGGTFAANPITCAAGVATLKLLREYDFYKKLDAKGALFEKAVTSFNDNCFEIRVKRFGSLLTLVPGLNADGVFNSYDWNALFSCSYSSFLEEGVLLPPSIDEPIFISAVHGDDQIVRSAEAVARIVKKNMSCK